MKYSELIQFDPIESVVQLRTAGVEADARRLIQTYVISERMADCLRELVFPQLQFTKPVDNKGLLIVGNYGTGKSHLMAVISAVAERADLAPLLTNGGVADAAKSIAGRFKVIRAEIGATTKGLRDIICDVLEDGLERLGVTFSFPAADARHENKTAFEEMMTAFQAKFPDAGLLLVVDELLDYLRARQDQAISLDLSFLRELGEICKGTRFRFIAGVQETLFDNPRFQFVADTVRRVKDRFEQVRIAREDVAFVVAERLLRKDANQRARIREHLARFASLYGELNERLEDFVRLFPVHPAYIETFGQIHVAEKREVLKTLSAAIRRILGQDVPTAEPGLIALDSYWSTLRENPSFRTDPAIKDVIEKSALLESKVQQAFTRPQYKPQALRIIHALSVHRLTTPDVRDKVGVTPQELRDDLCLTFPGAEPDAAFTLTLVETVLREIRKTVSGQYITQNPENGQYYLDLDKDIPFDDLIDRKGETLNPSQLDNYYFDALRRVVLENPDAPSFVSGYRIWEHELEWRDRKAGRSGYLFFGAPNERSTAHPSRDFYLYFVQPYEPPYFKDEKKADEVFLRLKRRDEAFDRTLKLYAGAREQAGTSSGSNKKVYEDKAVEHLKALTRWLIEQMPTAVEVTHQGRAKPLIDVVRGKLPSGAVVRDYVDTAGSVLLASHFDDQSKDYPIFTVLLTRQNREQAAQDALRWIAGGVKSKQATAVLDALELLDGDVLQPRKSRYARHVMEALEAKGPTQVVNRAELVQSEGGVEYWTRFRLEPEFLAVVAAALVHSGDLVLSIPGKRVDAAAIEQFAKLGVREVAEFKHLERPRDLPLGPLQDLCELLGLPRGQVVTPATREEAVVGIQQRVGALVTRVVAATARLGDLIFWGKSVLSEIEQGEWRNRLAALKAFFESLQPFNTAGKLKNFPHDSKTVLSQKPGLELVREVEALVVLGHELAPMTSYLGRAEALLETSHPWHDEVRARRGDLLAKLASPKHRADAVFQRQLGETLKDLKVRYQDAYMTAHQRARLGSTDEKRRAGLMKDPRLAKLQKLAIVEMMPTQQLRALETQLTSLRPCVQLGRPEIEADAVCPRCEYRPAEEPAASVPPSKVLGDADQQLDTLLAEWTRTLLENLADPTVAGNVDLVSDAGGKRDLRDFIQTKELQEAISPALQRALQEVLSGLQRVVLRTGEMRAALLEGGMPCTPTDLTARFERHVAALSKGKDAAKVRILLE